jgi:hypothetical protein
MSRQDWENEKTFAIVANPASGQHFWRYLGDESLRGYDTPEAARLAFFRETGLDEQSMRHARELQYGRIPASAEAPAQWFAVVYDAYPIPEFKETGMSEDRLAFVLGKDTADFIVADRGDPMGSEYPPNYRRTMFSGVLRPNRLKRGEAVANARWPNKIFRIGDVSESLNGEPQGEVLEYVNGWWQDFCRAPLDEIEQDFFRSASTANAPLVAGDGATRRQPTALNDITNHGLQTMGFLLPARGSVTTHQLADMVEKYYDNVQTRAVAAEFRKISGLIQKNFVSIVYSPETDANRDEIVARNAGYRAYALDDSTEWYVLPPGVDERSMDEIAANNFATEREAWHFAAQSSAALHPPAAVTTTDAVVSNSPSPEPEFADSPEP